MLDNIHTHAHIYLFRFSLRDQDIRTDIKEKGGMKRLTGTRN